MAIPPAALKRKNHRLLLCEQARKNALISHLIEIHKDKRIAVAVSGPTDAVTVPDGVVVLSDSALPKEGEASFDLIISYDLPNEPQRYLERLALCDDMALTLMDESDQKQLLAIEALLGRAIFQERPESFAPPLPAQPKPKPRAKRVPDERERAPREKRAEKAPFKKEGRPEQKRKPRESGVSRYIGTDENGKPMFSGKTGERNHRKDGRPHDEESIAAKKEWDEKRKMNGGKKPYDANKRPPFKGENDRRKPYDKTGERRDSEGGEKKHFDKKKPAFKGERKPYEGKAPYRGEKKPGEGKAPYQGERKPYAEKDASKGERKPSDGKAPFKGKGKPFGAKAPFKGDKKPFGAKGPKGQSSEPAREKRPPRRIKADALKKKDTEE